MNTNPLFIAIVSAVAAALINGVLALMGLFVFRAYSKRADARESAKIKADDLREQARIAAAAKVADALTKAQRDTAEALLDQQRQVAADAAAHAAVVLAAQSEMAKVLDVIEKATNSTNSGLMAVNAALQGKLRVQGEKLAISTGKSDDTTSSGTPPTAVKVTGDNLEVATEPGAGP